MTEYLSAIGSYTLNYDDVTLGQEFFENGECRASRFLCEAIGQRTSSILGLTFNYNTLDSRLRPTRGETLSWTTEFAGVGGDVKYVRSRARGGKFWSVGGGFIFSLAAEGGWIRSLEDRNIPGQDDVRLTDRFFLGEPQMRGFDIRGIGPRIVRLNYVEDPANPEGPPVLTSLEDALASNQRLDDSLGGKAYYQGRAELEIPLGSGVRELGIRPSVWLDVGSLFSIKPPVLIDQPNGRQVTSGGQLVYTGPLFDENGAPVLDGSGDPVIGQTFDATAPDGTPNAPLVDPNSFYREVFVGDSASPRIAAGIGVNWNSPFGPFRIDVSHVIKKQPGDDTKTFSFNVGTQF